MGDIMTQVRQWRTNADELRAAAAWLSNPVAIEAYLQMADGYDALADRMEDLEVDRRASAPSLRH